MHGKNPIRKPAQGDGSTLEVQHIFYTLQGEGLNAGLPAVFVRLGGCNLACDFCDTEFESFVPMSVETIVSKVGELSEGRAKLVVITGGEPLRQPIGKLCEALLAEGLLVQIETNGTLFKDLPAEVEWVCSPKNTGNGYMPLRPDVLERLGALKFIISASKAGYQDIGEVGQPAGLPVYVQPMDEQDANKNAANLKHATRLAMQKGYRLSVQLHKLAGIE